jgi:hypothetical protein
LPHPQEALQRLLDLMDVSMSRLDISRALEFSR